MTEYPESVPPMKIDLTLGVVAHYDSRVLLDGVDVTRHVRYVAVAAGVGMATEVQLTLSNVEATVDGLAFVAGRLIPVIEDTAE